MYDLKNGSWSRRRLAIEKSFNHVTLLMNSPPWSSAQQLNNLSASYLALVRDLQLPFLDDNYMAVTRYNHLRSTDSDVSQRFNVIPT